MPLYEVTTLGSDKLSVVFEFGRQWTRVGFVSESCPRVILRTETRTGSRNLLDINNDRELLTELREFIESLYFRYLAVNPRDRKVVIVESIFTSGHFRSILSQVFFNHFDVPAIAFLPSHLMSLMTLMVPSGLVVDVGYLETTIIPIIEGITVLDSSTFSCSAAKSIHDRIRKELMERQAVSSIDGDDFKFRPEVISSLSEKLIEDIKVRCCFVPSIDRGLKLIGSKKSGQPLLDPSPADVDYALEGNVTLRIPGFVRESSCNSLFEIEGNESTSIATAILDAILNCPIDSRKLLMNNIVLIGGTAMTTGFKKRIKRELEALVASCPDYSTKFPSKLFSFHALPCHPNYSNWLGGAIYGSTDAINSKLITKQLWSTSGQLSDWTTWSPIAN